MGANKAILLDTAILCQPSIDPVVHLNLTYMPSFTCGANESIGLQGEPCMRGAGAVRLYKPYHDS